MLDDEMLDLSIKARKLHLRVYYKTFRVEGWQICGYWDTEVITIKDLKYAEDYKPFSMILLQIKKTQNKN